MVVLEESIEYTSIYKERPNNVTMYPVGLGKSKTSTDYVQSPFPDIGLHVLFSYFFFIEHLCLVGMWLGEDQGTNIVKTRDAYKRLDHIFRSR